MSSALDYCSYKCDVLEYCLANCHRYGDSGNGAYKLCESRCYNEERGRFLDGALLNIAKTALVGTLGFGAAAYYAPPGKLRSMSIKGAAISAAFLAISLYGLYNF